MKPMKIQCRIARRLCVLGGWLGGMGTTAMLISIRQSPVDMQPRLSSAVLLVIGCLIAYVGLRRTN